MTLTSLIRPVGSGVVSDTSVGAVASGVIVGVGLVDGGGLLDGWVDGFDGVDGDGEVLGGVWLTSLNTPLIRSVVVLLTLLSPLKLTIAVPALIAWNLTVKIRAMPLGDDDRLPEKVMLFEPTLIDGDPAAVYAVPLDEVLTTLRRLDGY